MRHQRHHLSGAPLNSRLASLPVLVAGRGFSRTVEHEVIAQKRIATKKRKYLMYMGALLCLSMKFSTNVEDSL